MTNLTFRCQCGQIEGTLNAVSPRSGNHMVCYCDDCQAFARYLGGEERWLDQWGGTAIFQLAPASITLHKGQEQIRCVRLKHGGLYRFYSGCCKTPIANTLSRNMPFAGIPTAIIHGEQKKTALGPIKAYVMGKYAKGVPPTQPHSKFSLKSLLLVMAFMLKNKLQRRNVPTPFFRDDGKAIIAPDDVPERRESS